MFTDPTGLISTGSAKTDCEINAFANGAAQVVPYLGAYLGFRGQSVELLNSSNPRLLQTGVNFLDIVSGALSSAAEMVDTDAADAVAERYRGAQYKTLGNGNKAYRRELRAANGTIWQGTKSGMKGLGNALEIVGAVTAIAGIHEDLKKCGCNGN